MCLYKYIRIYILPDLLRLDEPTNHLDLDAVIWLQQVIHMHTYTYVCCMQTCTIPVCMYVVYVSMHAYMYACIYVCMHACIYIYMCIYGRCEICIHICMYLYLDLCIYVSVYVCVYFRIFSFQTSPPTISILMRQVRNMRLMPWALEPFLVGVQSAAAAITKLPHTILILVS